MRRGAKLRYVAGILGVIAKENALKMACPRVFPAENHRHYTLVEYTHFISHFPPLHFFWNTKESTLLVEYRPPSAKTKNRP